MITWGTELGHLTSKPAEVAYGQRGPRANDGPLSQSNRMRKRRRDCVVPAVESERALIRLVSLAPNPCHARRLKAWDCDTERSQNAATKR